MIGSWVRGIFAASLLSSVALALAPPGRVKAVTKMMCGLMCALAVAGPLLRLDVESVAVGIAAYEQQARKIQEAGEEEGKMLERTYIEERCAAYILGKAEEMAVPAEGVTVEARWDGDALVWYPWSVSVDGAFSPALARTIEGDLGVPPGRQIWRDDG